MPIDLDIGAFVKAIGANELVALASGARTRKMFRRQNYFSLNGRSLIVKVSRSTRSFWGVGKQYIDFFNDQDEYFLVLLCSAIEGWVFSKAEVNANIKRGKWALAAAPDYKINMPLPDANSFATPKQFLARISRPAR